MVEKVKPDPWNLSVNTGVGKQNIITNFRRDFDKCRSPHNGGRFLFKNLIVGLVGGPIFG